MTGKTLSIVMPDEASMGPKFQALRSDMQKSFILAYLHGGNPRRAAVAAGYSNSSEHVLTVTVSRLLNDQAILEVIQECSLRYMHSLIPTALAVVTEILHQPNHKERAKVALSVLDRTGLQGISEHRVIVEKDPDRAELEAGVRTLCTELGIDADALLANVWRKALPAPATKSGPEVTDADFSEVGSTEGLEDIL